MHVSFPQNLPLFCCKMLECSSWPFFHAFLIPKPFPRVLFVLHISFQSLPLLPPLVFLPFALISFYFVKIYIFSFGIKVFSYISRSSFTLHLIIYIYYSRTRLTLPVSTADGKINKPGPFNGL